MIVSEGRNAVQDARYNKARQHPTTRNRRMRYLPTNALTQTVDAQMQSSCWGMCAVIENTRRIECMDANRTNKNYGHPEAGTYRWVVGVLYH
uniref:Pept_C1 domain-containing protein n=1 Tax=Ascaris lumbricoides TaxID=6252 RepID=A0A0M3HTE7_ASCLU